MFNTYTPMQYLAVDIANTYGLDKDIYEDRIQWVRDNIDRLEDLIPQAEEPYLYDKAVNALRLTQRGMPVGHTVALDAVCSGLQIMSAVMGCEKGCALTGLIHPDVRTDAYSLLTEAMNKKVDIVVPRKDAKSAVMKGFYGSVAVPKEIFGDLVDVFYETLYEECPGATQLLELLRDAWSSEVDRNTWQLPDGHIAMVPVTATVEKKIHIAQLKYTPVVNVQIAEPQERGISLIANCIHSIDAYVLRTMIRRCNYKPRMVKQMLRTLETQEGIYTEQDSTYLRVWKDTGMVDMTMLEATNREIQGWPREMRKKLIRMLNICLTHAPFELITIHDSFACHPVNCNQLRRVYADILGDLVDSTLIDDLLNQIYQTVDTVEKLSDTKKLAAIVRESNYGIS